MANLIVLLIIKLNILLQFGNGERQRELREKYLTVKIVTADVKEWLNDDEMLEIIESTIVELIEDEEKCK